MACLVGIPLIEVGVEASGLSVRIKGGQGKGEGGKRK